MGILRDRRPVPDALMIRRVSASVTALCRVPEHRISVFLEGGWSVLLTESQVRAVDIADVYRADLKERR